MQNRRQATATCLCLSMFSSGDDSGTRSSLLFPTCSLRGNANVNKLLGDPLQRTTNSTNEYCFRGYIGHDYLARLGLLLGVVREASADPRLVVAPHSRCSLLPRFRILRYQSAMMMKPGRPWRYIGAKSDDRRAFSTCRMRACVRKLTKYYKSRFSFREF